MSHCKLLKLYTLALNRQIAGARIDILVYLFLAAPSALAKDIEQHVHVNYLLYKSGNIIKLCSFDGA